ncbi:MAG: hypothetical protein SW833_19685 [Cyanobacteriota bacterium]|nr:hypothetical protein [Cyanobacteriota bacterium]
MPQKPELQKFPAISTSLQNSEHDKSRVNRESRTVQKARHDFYGLDIFEIDDREYIAFTVEQAELAALQLAKECLDSIETELLLKHSYLPSQAAPLIRYLQEGCCETEIKLLTSIIIDLNALAKEAVALYGWSHFVKLYDSNIELSWNHFPTEYADFILNNLGLKPTQQNLVCLYQLGI